MALELPANPVLAAALALAILVAIVTPLWVLVLGVVALLGDRAWAKRQVQVAGLMWLVVVMGLGMYVFVS